jgi:hypothetical protein
MAERWQLVHGLLDQGVSLKEICRRTGLSRGSVRRLARAGAADELVPGPRPSPGRALDAHRDFLAEQWATGNTNAADLLRQLRERGYTGSSSGLRQYLHPWRSQPPRTAAHQQTLSAGTKSGIGTVPSMREVTGWICRHPDKLTDTQRRNLTVVRTACPDLDVLVGHVRSFAAMLTQLAGHQLNDWIHAVQADRQPQLHSFVRGLLADYDAVRAGLTLHHNSGPVEGNVNRIILWNLFVKG